MYAEYSIFAVVFSGQQHAGPEILQFVRDALKTSDHRFRFFLVFEFFRDLDQFRYLIKFFRQPVIQSEPVLEDLFLFQDFLGTLLIIPESGLQTFVLQLLYPFCQTRRVKDNLPLPLSAAA